MSTSGVTLISAFQSLADGSSQGVDVASTLAFQLGEHPDDADHRAQQPDEGGEGADGGQGQHALLEQVADLGAAPGNGAFHRLDHVMAPMEGLELFFIPENIQAVLEHQSHVTLVVGHGGLLRGFEVAQTERLQEQLEEAPGGRVAPGIDGRPARSRYRSAAPAGRSTGK